MPLPVIPIGIATLTVVSYFVSRKRKRIQGMTAQRQIIFDSALKKVKDPEKLRTLADSFQKAGLPVQAELLRKRAALRELPQDIKDARREAFKKALTSTNIVAIRKLADAFAAEGATASAQKLREYAAGLRPGDVITPHDPTADDLAEEIQEVTTDVPAQVPNTSVTPKADDTQPIPPQASESGKTLDVTDTTIVTESIKPNEATS